MSESEKSYYVMSLRTEVTGSDAINIPANKFTYIGMDEIHFPNAVSVGKNAFFGCASILEIDLPLVKTIGDAAFMSCSNSEYINIPEALTIGNNAFSGCSSARYVNMPKATTIGYNAFQDCSSLTQIDIPNVTNIGENAFRGCDNIVRLSVNNVQSIGGRAFFGCKKLKDISLPKVVEFGNAAFAECKKIEKIDIPNAIALDKDAFVGCDELKVLNLQNVPVSQLHEGMFSSLKKLQWLNVQKELTYGSVNMEYRKFLGLSKSCNVICRDGIRYKNDDGGESSRQDTYLVYNDSPVKPTVLGVKSGKTLPETFIEGYAQTISSDVFRNRTELKSVHLMAVSREIGARAFYGCSNLESIGLPLLIVSNEPGYGIKTNAFKDCPNLRYVLLGTASMSEVQSKMRTWGLSSGCTIVCSDGTLVVE